MNIITVAICLIWASCVIAAPERVQLINLLPEEVQKLLDKQNTDVRFAPKINTIEVARKSPEDPEDLVEDVYEVSQFHGQDGLGRYLYGYANPNHAKVEDRRSDGNLRGSYSWVEPNGEVVKVKYWDDGTGFHHEDNIPKVVLEPAKETEAVRLARLEHERVWKEAAAANKVSPSQYSLVYKDDASNSNAVYTAAETNESPEVRSDEGKWVPSEDEVTSEPRGFFYSFQYPAGIQYPKSEYDAKKLRSFDDVTSLNRK